MCSGRPQSIAAISAAMARVSFRAEKSGEGGEGEGAGGEEEQRSGVVLSLSCPQRRGGHGGVLHDDHWRHAVRAVCACSVLREGWQGSSFASAFPVLQHH